MELGESSFPRRQTRQVMVGDVPVGGGAPITVQSMTITKTADVEGTLQQIYALAAAGCDIVRCTCNEQEAAEGLAQISDTSSLEPLVRRILDAHPEIVAEIRAGKDRKFQFLVGQVMKETRGKGDPKIVTELMKAAIG